MPAVRAKRNEVNMIHLGDITKIHGDEIEPVDCITFGSPCQDLSIAGRRAGLAGERSGLFMEAVRIIKEMRSSTNGLCPTFAIWENVPGAFSSNNGEDFRAVLEELARIGQPDAAIPGPTGGADGARPVQSPETDGLWLGDSWTVNISEWPSAESVSLLSSTLEVNAPEKYYLSARACQGILTRASRRGKKLPELLQTALLEMVEWWEPGASARVMEALAAEEQKRRRQEKLAALNERKERLEEIAVKQLRIRLKSALGAPEAERALLCKQKKSGHYRHSKTKRSSN